MNNVYKRMIFYFFAGEDFETNTANLIHFNCLHYYQDVFDEININIAVDNVEDYDFQIRVKYKLSQVLNRCRNLKFKIVKNTGYRETSVFYNEIMQKLDKNDGLTFWGHNKGTTNFLNPKNDKYSIANWICGLYYFSLNFINEAENQMLSDGMPFYGSFLFEHKVIPSIFHLEYAGTFFWLNCPLIYRDYKINNLVIPSLDARGYAEEIAGNLYNRDKLGSHSLVRLFSGDFYSDSKSITDFCASDKKEEYYKYVSKMLEGIEHE